MSRWTRPRVWAWCSASATVATSSADSRERRPALPHPLGQVAALDVLRDDEAEAVVGPADVVDRDDVRVVEPGQGAGLGQVGLDVLGAGDPLGVGHLDRDRAVELVVAGQVDPPESPLAQPPDHPVAADRRRDRHRHGHRPGRTRSLRGPRSRRVRRRIRGPVRNAAPRPAIRDGGGLFPGPCVVGADLLVHRMNLVEDQSFPRRISPNIIPTWRERASGGECGTALPGSCPHGLEARATPGYCPAARVAVDLGRLRAVA